MDEPVRAEAYLLVGAGITNLAVAAALLARGHTVILTDDGAADRLHDNAGRLDSRTGRLEVLHRPSSDDLADIVQRVDAVVPTPGLPEAHPVFSLAADSGVPVLSEFDLAAEWDDRPVVAITGTNGKTTVTTLVTNMLNASGRRAVAVGNTDTPLVAALDDSLTDVFVVEASSFRLAHSRRFGPSVAVWLNFAGDHLDVHRDMESYRAAKARIWTDQGAADLAIANADDPVVVGAVRADADSPQVQYFGLGSDPGVELSATVRGGHLVIHGEELIPADELWSQMPHDRTNVLAAALAALRAGATREGVRSAAASFSGLAHRVELVSVIDGVAYYDDSKATAPHATLAALQGFDSVVLIAGGRNKGLDLNELGAARDRVRAVVAIGEAAHEIIAAFDGIEASTASSMHEAVDVARSLAAPGDAVLLSPACASFDWYDSYAARGNDFARHVSGIEGATT